jgi:hypothetical protein
MCSGLAGRSSKCRRAASPATSSMSGSAFRTWPGGSRPPAAPGGTIRVLQDGLRSLPASVFKLVDRHGAGMDVAQALASALRRPDEPGRNWKPWPNLPWLAESWRGYARRRLESRRVEDWSKAPDGHRPGQLPLRAISVRFPDRPRGCADRRSVRRAPLMATLPFSST